MKPGILVKQKIKKSLTSTFVGAPAGSYAYVPEVARVPFGRMVVMGQQTIHPKETAAACRRLLAEVGADVLDSSGGPGELHLNAWSPPGFIWNATDCHSLSVHFLTDRAAAWQSLLQDLQLGLSPCEEPDCEGCE